MLAAASAVFYLLGPGGWTVVLGGVACLLAGICVTAWRYPPDGPVRLRRRRTMVLACVYHIAVLVGFKYTEFLTGGAVEVGWAPLGLSFFTFQQLWLLKEVYTGEYVPAPGDSLLLYGLFFPTVTSGPILRPESLFPPAAGEADSSIRTGPTPRRVSTPSVCGTIKKVLLADAFGTVVNNGWAQLEELSAPAAWLVILGYTLQLYFDFSGYCDIASRCGPAASGVRLPMNFDIPVPQPPLWGSSGSGGTSPSPPSCGSACTFPWAAAAGARSGRIANILIVFLVSGFWHGAGWTFLIWGALHGAGPGGGTGLGQGPGRACPVVLRWGLTFLFVNIAWVFFRAPDCAGALELLGRAVTGGFAKPAGLAAGGPFLPRRPARCRC